MKDLMRDDKHKAEEVSSHGFRILSGEETFDLDKYSFQSEAAKEYFQKALSLDPNCYDALMGMGICNSYDPREYNKAIAAFKRAIEIRPNEAEPYYQAGLIFLLDSDRNYENPIVSGKEEALQHFQKALELGYKPQSWLYNHIGTVYSRMGLYGEAINCFEHSIKYMENEGTWIPSVFFLAADACETLGKDSEAIKWLVLYKKQNFGSDTEEIDQRINNLKIISENRKKAL
jgi:tetratricopeptide (TPR) repeat protein